MKTIICDLDGTLFNIEHRLHLLEEKRFDEFYAACKDDTPNEWCVELLNALIFGNRNDCSPQYNLMFISGRSEVVREETQRQLTLLGLYDLPLYMRPKSNHYADYKFKSRLFDNIPALCEADILFVIEDRTRVVEMWRAKGLTVLQCAGEGY